MLALSMYVAIAVGLLAIRFPDLIVGGIDILGRRVAERRK